VQRASASGAERAWCLYDWGNSAFAAVCMTALLPPYLAGLANAELGAPAGTAMWGWTAALGLLAGVLLAPVLGALADARAWRLRLLAAFAISGAVATALLAVALPASWRAGAALYVIAATGFATANVFYDALLPGLGPPQRWDAISARGYAFGYAGGGLALAGGAAIAMAGGQGAIRWAFLLAAGWWLLFTIPVLRRVHEPAAVGTAGAFDRLRETARHARSHPTLWRFLLAYWVYNDGIGTVIKMAGAYGAELGIPLAHMLGALLLTQAVGIPATLAFGRLGGRIGAKRGIQVALAGYVVIALLGVFMKVAWHFWLLAGLVGVVQGGAQALSRSLYARLLPAGREAEFFSFFDVSGRMAGVIGPALFAVLTTVFGSGRAGVGAVLVFFVAGLWLLSGVAVCTGDHKRVRVAL
jgi:MFS transporter, UMF1 family